MSAQDVYRLLPLLLIVVFFYVVVLRPQRSRQRQAAELQARIHPGQEVMTTSGLYAVVRSVDGDVVVLEASPGVLTRWARAAVVRVVEPTAASTPTSASESPASTPTASTPTPAPDALTLAEPGAKPGAAENAPGGTSAG